MKKLRLFLYNLQTSQYFYSFMALLVVVVFSSLVSGSFFTGNNLMTIIRQASVLLILSSGLTAVVLTGGIDLSVNNTAALVGCIVAQLLVNGVNIALVIVVGLIIGVLVGLFNGVLVGMLKLPPFVATYGTNMVVLGLATIVMQGAVVYDLPRNFTPIGIGFLGGVPVPVILAFFVIVIFYVLLQLTTFGREIYMLGSNANAARYSGARSVLIYLEAYALSGFTAALGGIVMTARLNAADANMGNSYGLQIVAAVVMGGTSLLGGSGGIFGTMIGAIVLTIIVNVMNLVGVNSYLQSLAIGIVIICMVWLDIFSRNKSERLSKTFQIESTLKKG